MEEVGYTSLTHPPARNTHLGRNQRAGFGVPPPETLVGQVSAAPPAINPVVPAKILVASQHRLAELGQRQLRPLVPIEATGIVVHLERKRTFIQSRHGRPLASRKASSSAP